MIMSTERMRLALDRRLSMANLPEKLARLYGSSPALVLPHPFMPSLAPRAHISFREVLHLTDVAAEALIRAMDLRKGERVLVLARDAGECLLLVLSLIKAGGIAVPLPRLPEKDDLEAVLREGGISKALASGSFLGGCEARDLDLLMGRGGFRLMPVGSEEAKPGVVSLEEACAESSGFFIPYTLKPSSVVMLSPRAGAQGRPLLVMSTSRALLHPSRVLSCLLPAEKGESCLFLSVPEGPSSLASAVLALSAGLCLHFPPDGGSSPPHKGSAWEPRIVVADPPRMARSTEDRGAMPFPASVRLFICTGKLDGLAVNKPISSSFHLSWRDGRALLLEFDSLDETAPLAIFRLSFPFGNNLFRTPFLPLPPHRVRRKGQDTGGARAVKAIRGPGVAPGWWNDLESSLRCWKKGWFHPGSLF